MIKVLFGSLMALALTACKPTEEEVKRVRDELPQGCELKYLGSYGSIDNLVIAVCDGRRTTSTHWTESYQCGKYRCTREQASFYFAERSR